MISNKSKCTGIAIFCSGSGSNAQKIMEYFQDSELIEVKLLLSNKTDAYALERAKKFNIPTRVFSKDEFQNSEIILDELLHHGVKWVVLAGFLWLVPVYLVQAFPNRIINIHPALLPLYGGKGMYGMKVHEAVVEKGEKETGITIHFVNEAYDEGSIIFQARCPVNAGDSADVVAKKVQKLEHEYFPQVLKKIILSTEQ